jgi:hypothetical protein
VQQSDNAVFERERESRRSSPLAASSRKTKPGRNKAMPRRACHPKSWCAAMIAEAWSFFHGQALTFWDRFMIGDLGEPGSD